VVQPHQVRYQVRIYQEQTYMYAAAYAPAVASRLLSRWQHLVAMAANLKVGREIENWTL